MYFQLYIKNHPKKLPFQKIYADFLLAFIAVTKKVVAGDF